MAFWLKFDLLPAPIYWCVTAWKILANFWSHLLICRCMGDLSKILVPFIDMSLHGRSEPNFVPFTDMSLHGRSEQNFGPIYWYVTAWKIWAKFCPIYWYVAAWKIWANFWPHLLICRSMEDLSKFLVPFTDMSLHGRSKQNFGPNYWYVAAWQIWAKFCPIYWYVAAWKICANFWSHLLICRGMEDLKKPCYGSHVSDPMSWIYNDMVVTFFRQIKLIVACKSV